MTTVFDAAFTEHDTAMLFFRLMRSTKPWYEFAPHKHDASKFPHGKVSLERLWVFNEAYFV